MRPDHFGLRSFILKVLLFMRPVSADNVWMFQAHPAAKLLLRKVVCTAFSPLASFLEKEGGEGKRIEPR